MTAERAKARKRVMVSKVGKVRKRTGGRRRRQGGGADEEKRVVRKANKKTSSSKEFIFSILSAKKYVTAGRSAGTKGGKTADLSCSYAAILPGLQDICGPLRPRTHS